METLRYEEVR